MQNPDELFLTTKQEAKKLTIALNRLFGGEPLRMSLPSAISPISGAVSVLPFSWR